MSKSKRRRTDVGRSSTRPIDKKLIVISHNDVANTQVTTNLYTAVFPVTITGLRWDIDSVHDATATTGDVGVYSWAIVHLREGTVISTISTSDASTMYAPEQNVLAFASGMNLHKNQVSTQEGATKTMRKLQGGDQLVWVGVGESTHTTGFQGVIQFFTKS